MRSRPMISTGIMTLITVLVVVTMATFATLCINTARQDAALSKKNAEAVTDYYAADELAQRALRDVRALVASPPSDWQSRLRALGALTMEGGRAQLTLRFPLEQSILSVSLSFPLSAGRPSGQVLVEGYCLINPPSVPAE